MGAAAVIGCAAIAAVVMAVQELRSSAERSRKQSTVLSIRMASGMESVLLAYRMAEIKYIEAMTACDSAQPFLTALAQGSGCSVTAPATPPDVTVFTGSDFGSDDHLYTYSGAGCTISVASSTCASGSPIKIMTIGGGPTPDPILAGVSYEIYFVKANPPKQMSEYQMVMNTQDGKTLKSSFGIRTTATNLAHFEADGRVTQENPDPLAKCIGAPWATYPVYDAAASKCTTFQQIAGGTGLAYYSHHYFGFRPDNGQVIDLTASVSTASTTFMVNEDGTETGVPGKIFPPYSKAALTNLDDITLIGDQIYFVAGGGDTARIGVYDSVNDKNEMICDLSAQGYSQSYSGIAALSWSDSVFPKPTLATDVRLATFLLKTSGGDFLSAVILAKNTGHTCFVYKDASLQQIEYHRTYGFDRTVDMVPYFVF